jgi:NAD(P)-dependent dehydrogenase (short-subunit alcohol dehydrogenase family)
MRERRSGCIVNVSSVAGRISTSPLGPYAASKYALEAISEALAQEVKSLGIRVAVVQPGIIGTEMARGIGAQGPASTYPHANRLAALFTASLTHPTSPDLVAVAIRGIIESDSPRFHHPVGPDAEPFLDWRASLTDEQWIDWNAADDDAWYANMGRTFGLQDRRPKT